MIICRQDSLAESRNEAYAVDTKIMSLLCTSEHLIVSDQSWPDLHSTKSVGGDQNLSIWRKGDGENGCLEIPDGADQAAGAEIPQTHGLRDHALDGGGVWIEREDKTDLVIPGRGQDWCPRTEGCGPDCGAARLDKTGELWPGPGVPDARGAVSRGGAEQGSTRRQTHRVDAVLVIWKWELNQQRWR